MPNAKLDSAVFLVEMLLNILEQENIAPLLFEKELRTIGVCRKTLKELKSDERSNSDW